MKRRNICIIILTLTLVLAATVAFASCKKEAEPKELSFTATGDEANLPGYAEGVLTYNHWTEVGATYEAYWGNADGILPDHYFVAQGITYGKAEKLELNIGENVSIPADADRIVLVCKNGDNTKTVAECAIPTQKLPTVKKPEIIFASASDIHVNYVEGADYWTNALNVYESYGVRYVIISGDLTVDGGQYDTYMKATEASDFKGLIFTCIGNHEQQQAGRTAMFNVAIYDGAAKQWISLSDAGNYFSYKYNGDLDVSVFWKDYEGMGETYYYYATINNALYIFMDQKLYATGNSSLQDNFSDNEIAWLENVLNKYSGHHEVGGEFKYETYDLNIVEHALIKNFSAGDKFNGAYTQPIVLGSSFKRNNHFADILRAYSEAIWMSGHTHLGFGTSVDFVDKEYDADGNLTDHPIARSIHNSSVAQARWYENGGIVYKETYESGSEGYICYRFDDSIVFEGHAFKKYTPNSKDYNKMLMCDKIYSSSTFRIPVMVNEHEKVHSHLTGKTVMINPTRTTEGNVKVYCSECGEIMSTTTIDPIGTKPAALASLSGDGTEENPIIIGSTSDWRAFIKYVNDGSGSVAMPENMDIEASPLQPGYGLFFRQSADVTAIAKTETFSVIKGKHAVFAGDYDGAGFKLHLNNVTIADSVYSKACVLPFVTGTIKNLTVDGALKVKDLEISGALVQGVGKNAFVKDCTFNVDLFMYGSPTPTIFGSVCGRNATITGIKIGGSINSRSGTSLNGHFIDTIPSGATVSYEITGLTNGSIEDNK